MTINNVWYHYCYVGRITGRYDAVIVDDYSTTETLTADDIDEGTTDDAVATATLSHPAGLALTVF